MNIFDVYFNSLVGDIRMAGLAKHTPKNCVYSR